MVHSYRRHSADCLCFFVFNSQSGIRLLHFFHHLPQTLHFFHQSRRICAPIASKLKSIPSCLHPCLPTSRALVLYPTSTVAAYQMPASHYSFPTRCHRSSTSLEQDSLHRCLSRRTHPKHTPTLNPVYPMRPHEPATYFPDAPVCALHELFNVYAMHQW